MSWKPPILTRRTSHSRHNEGSPPSSSRAPQLPLSHPPGSRPDSRALAGQSLRASWLGRRNGVLYFVLAGTAITRDALNLTWPADEWLRIFGWLLVATTTLSMLDRAVVLVRLRRA